MSAPCICIGKRPGGEWPHTVECINQGIGYARAECDIKAHLEATPERLISLRSASKLFSADIESGAHVGASGRGGK